MWLANRNLVLTTLCVICIILASVLSFQTSGNLISIENYVVIDVDTGADDAWALIALIRAEELGLFKILGILCVEGNTDVDNVVKNTLRVLGSLNRTDIPVFRGCSKPIVYRPEVRSDNFFGLNGFGDKDQELDNCDCGGVDFGLVRQTNAVNALYDFVEKHPNQITLMITSQLTNLAACINVFGREVVDKIKDIWIMGGNVFGEGNTTPAAEFNFYMDTEAAYTVLQSVKRPVSLLPWEAMLEGRINITLDWRWHTLAVVDTKPVQMMNIVEKELYSGQNLWRPADAFLVAAFLFPDKMIVKEKLYWAMAELSGTVTRGAMVIDHKRPEAQSNVRAILEIDSEVFKEVVLWAVGAPNTGVNEWVPFNHRSYDNSAETETREWRGRQPPHWLRNLNSIDGQLSY